MTDTEAVERATQEIPTMVAIIMAARHAGDRQLERVMRQRLRDEHGVKIGFTRGVARGCQGRVR